MSTPQTFDREDAWHTLQVLEALFEYAGVHTRNDPGHLVDFLGADALDGVACLVQKCRMEAEHDLFPGGVPSLSAEPKADADDEGR